MRERHFFLGKNVNYSHPPKASYCVAPPRRTTAYCLRRRALSETFGGWLYIGCRIMDAITFSALFRSFRRESSGIVGAHVGFWTSDNGACLRHTAYRVAVMQIFCVPQSPTSQAVGFVRFWSLAVGQAPPYTFLLWVPPCGGERLAFWLCFARRVFCCRP